MTAAMSCASPKSPALATIPFRPSRCSRDARRAPARAPPAAQGVEQAEPGGAAVPDRAGKGRQHHRPVHSECPEESGEQHDQEQPRAVAHVTEAGQHLAPSADRRSARMKFAGPDGGNHGQHRQAQPGIGGEGGRGSGPGDHQPAQGRPGHGPELPDGVVEPDCRRKAGVAHHFVHEHLAGRAVQGAGDAQQDAAGVDNFDRDAPAGVPDGEAAGQDGGDGLAKEKDAALGKEIHHHAAERPHHQQGQELQCHGNAHRRRASGQLQHQPVLGKPLHPDAGAARELDAHEDAVVALHERPVPAAAAVRLSGGLDGSGSRIASGALVRVGSALKRSARGRHVSWLTWPLRAA